MGWLELDIYDSGNRGQEHKTPLVFIHGAWCGKWIWQTNFIPFFEERGYRCIAMDLPMHGKSGGRKKLNEYSMSDYADDVRAMIDSMGGDAVLIGHSMGGGVAEKMIAKGPAAAAVLLPRYPRREACRPITSSRNRHPGKMIMALVTRNMFVLVKDPKKRPSPSFLRTRSRTRK